MTTINPSREQFKAIFSLPLDTPVMMLNLLRFRDVAQYGPDDPEAKLPPVSGMEAYARYSEEATPVFESIGGTQHWVGIPEQTFIGPAEETWDLAFVARYPSAQVFADMLKNPAYQKATRHRTAATVDSRLIRCMESKPGRTFLPGK